MSIFEMVERYYPRLWSDARLEALVKAGRLTTQEVEAVRGNKQAERG